MTFDFQRRASRQSQQGVLIQQLTYAQGGPNLLASGVPRDSPLWGDRMLQIDENISPPDERTLWGNALHQHLARKEVHRGWSSLQHAFATAPRFGRTPHLIDPAYLQGSEGSAFYAGKWGQQGALNPYTFAKDPTQSFSTPPTPRQVLRGSFPYNSIPANKYTFTAPTSDVNRLRMFNIQDGKPIRAHPSGLIDYPASATEPHKKVD
jgi:hypothetical protein